MLRGFHPACDCNPRHQTRLVRSLALGMLCAWAAGCTMLEATAPAATPPAPLAWLTSWVSQPIELAPGFDVEELKPAASQPAVAPQNVLEVTIWDLYEPGRPYTYPVRVTDDHRIAVPMLGEVDVADLTLAQVEAALVEGFRRGDYLLNPRIIVRSLDAALLKIQVTGAVNRPGYVELTRADRSVYAAIVSAGGLSRLAGSEIGISRGAGDGADRNPDSRLDAPVREPTAPIATTDQPDTQVSKRSPVAEPQTAVQLANPAVEMSVQPDPDAASTRQIAPQRGLYSVPDETLDPAHTGPMSTGHSSVLPGPHLRGQDPPACPTPAVTLERKTGRESETVWYDVLLARDRDQLKSMVLSEGDMITVKTAAQPLRISGSVQRPGAYPLPPGRSVNVWQALDLAGGPRDLEVPLNISLVRPAAEGRAARRWTLNVAAFEQHPTASPLVEPGDELHVEPTAGSKIKRAVRNVWSKP